MNYPRVMLIGGAPMSGKTTVAHRLAATLGYGCLSTDDLGEAMRAVTTKDSHPHLHPMDGYDYRRSGHDGPLSGAQLLVQYATEGGGQKVRAHKYRTTPASTST